MQEIEVTGHLKLAKFYARRARRLLPALTLVLFATILAGYIICSPIEQRVIAPTAFTTAAYVSNLHFALVSTDYLRFPPESNPLLHMWSLSVEEQFYFAWPMLILFASRLARRFGGEGVKRGRILPIMVVVAAASFTICVWLTYVRQPWAFFSSPTRAWEFAVGGIGVLLAPPGESRKTRILGWLGLGAILCATVIFNTRTAFPGAAALLPALGTIAVLRACSVGISSGPGKYLSARWLQKIGQLSYSWYLWHWPVLVFATIVVGNLDLPARLICLAFSLALAAVSFHFVERPIRHKPALVQYPAYAFVMAAVLTVSALGTALVWRQVSAHAMKSPAQVRFTDASGDLPVFYHQGCELDILATTGQDCISTTEDGATTVVLFGDSHATQWFPALDSIARTEGWRFATLSKSMCPPADTDFVNPMLGRRYVECDEWRAAALRRIKELHPDLVVVTGSQAYASGRPPMITPAKWFTGTRSTLDALSQSAVRVVYLRDTPIPGFDVPACLARAAWQARWRSVASCNFERKTALDENVRQLEQQTCAGLKNVSYLDLTDYICPESTCDVERANLIVYRDSNHLTASFVRSLTSVLREKLKEVKR